VDPTLPLEGPERPAVGGRSPRPVREAPRFARALPVIAGVMALHRKKGGETLRHLGLLVRRQSSDVRFLRVVSLRASVISWLGSTHRQGRVTRRANAQNGLHLVALSPARVNGLDPLPECRVRGALLPGSGHDCLFAVTPLSHHVFFCHLFLPVWWAAGGEDSSEDGNLHRVQWEGVARQLAGDVRAPDQKELTQLSASRNLLSVRAVKRAMLPLSLFLLRPR